MRILHVAPNYLPAYRYGGPIRSVHGLCKALVRAGCHVSVYTTNMDGNGSLPVPCGVPVSIDGVEVTYFPVSFRRLAWSSHLKRVAISTIASFDVAHLHTVFLQPTWAAARAATAARVPYVVSPRGMLTRDLIRMRNRVVKAAWIDLIERSTFSAASGIHVTSEIEREELRLLHIISPRTVCIANGVDVPKQSDVLKGTLPVNLPKNYALFLSRINWKKGLDRLIKAWRLVPELDLVIAGNDEEGYSSKLQQLACDLGVQNRIQFIGAATEEDKWILYQRAEVFVLPSYSENFGNVVSEAMAMGCPVVVTPEVGISPIIAQRECGLVVAGDEEPLAAAILCLHGNPELRARMGERGRQAVADLLSWDRVATEMLALYKASSDRGSG